MVAQLLLGVIGFLPGIALIYVVLGRHEEHFRDEAMFLSLLGGLIVGLLAAVSEIFIITGSAILFSMLTLPLVETMMKTMVCGLPRFRNNPETILLGGAVGAGLAAMLFMFYGQFIRSEALTWQLGVALGSVSLGFTCTHFVTGMLIGQGPANGKVLGGFFKGYLYLLPAHVLFGLEAVNLTGGNRPFFGSMYFALAMAVYGVVLLAWKGPTLTEQGLPPEERQRLRRERRKKAREAHHQE